MNFFGAALKAWDAAQEAKGAVQAARQALEAGRGPLGALRAFAAETGTTLDDAAVAELEAGLRTAVQGLELVVSAVATVARVLADPQTRKAVDTAIGALVDNGYRASMARITVQAWLRG